MIHSLVPIQLLWDEDWGLTSGAFSHTGIHAFVAGAHGHDLQPNSSVTTQSWGQSTMNPVTQYLGTPGLTKGTFFVLQPDGIEFLLGGNIIILGLGPALI